MALQHQAISEVFRRLNLEQSMREACLGAVGVLANQVQQDGELPHDHTIRRWVEAKINDLVTLVNELMSQQQIARPKACQEIARQVQQHGISVEPRQLERFVQEAAFLISYPQDKATKREFKRLQTQYHQMWDHPVDAAFETLQRQIDASKKDPRRPTT